MLLIASTALPDLTLSAADCSMPPAFLSHSVLRFTLFYLKTCLSHVIIFLCFFHVALILK